jgi:hypothetical protein
MIALGKLRDGTRPEKGRELRRGRVALPIFTRNFRFSVCSIRAIVSVRHRPSWRCVPSRAYSSAVRAGDS